ncbi:like-Sm domain-containing protein [Hypoxylon fragiforme]|uniref:like-Sm domain-containing protein n=1 Tax=Hypoxylon fragiforme TaxID=63214 RepID=UPI0020C66E47|nr:like-Sm domain-containing protein [Hypoxylon fragiforme]KAI2610671.1 like-Sm domain-containing protein [Hypoxylon fragiforme]
MSFVPINPRPMLQDLVNKDIVVRLKWGETEYHGRLVSSDSYMNIQLTNAQEFIDQKFTSDLGQILIRWNGNGAGSVTRETRTDKTYTPKLKDNVERGTREI